MDASSFSWYLDADKFQLSSNGSVVMLNWIGISELDGSLRFETPETDLAVLFGIFNDPEHTRTLTRVFDEDRKTFEGFTVFKGIERMPTGNTVIRLRKE